MLELKKVISDISKEYALCAEAAKKLLEQIYEKLTGK